MKEKFLDENGKYIPTWEEMGITNEDYEKKVQSVGIEQANNWYDSKISHWQEKHYNDKKKKALSAEWKKEVGEKSHWYNTLDKDLIRSIAERSVEHYEGISADYISTLKEDAVIRKYYESLSARIFKENIKLDKVPYSKLKRFPYYDHSTGKVYGSDYRFMVMYSALFPSIKVSKIRSKSF